MLPQPTTSTRRGAMTGRRLAGCRRRRERRCGIVPRRDPARRRARRAILARMSIASCSGRTFGAWVLSLCGGALAAQNRVAVGAAAPDLTFDELLNASQPVQSLADLRGSAVLLEFWATWCGPCRAQMPHIKQLHASY